MAKNKRYECVAGPFSYWKEASEWANGYNAAKGVNWQSPEAVSQKLMRDMYDGYTKGFKYNDGFFVVKTVILTAAQKKEIDQKELQKKATEAATKAISAIKEAERLQKLVESA